MVSLDATNKHRVNFENIFLWDILPRICTGDVECWLWFSSLPIGLFSDQLHQVLPLLVRPTLFTVVNNIEQYCWAWIRCNNIGQHCWQLWTMWAAHIVQSCFHQYCNSLIIFSCVDYLRLQQLWYHILNYVYPNPHCQLSLSRRKPTNFGRTLTDSSHTSLQWESNPQSNCWKALALTTVPLKTPIVFVAL